MKISQIFYLALLLVLVQACKKEEPPVVAISTTEGSINVIHDEFEGVPLVVAGNVRNNYMVAFERVLEDGTVLEFEAFQRALPVIMQDNEGNKWSIQGLAVEGPRTGERLKTVNSYIGFWFAWGTMFPGIELYDGPAYTDDFSQDAPAPGWAIPTSNVFTVLGLDAIPAVDEPQFEVYDQRDVIENDDFFLSDDELAVGISYNGVTRVYPHRILNWHEIVNDKIDDFYFALSFCPITGTATMWERTVNTKVTTFGVSGLLYNGNVIPYDRETQSLWSQMKQLCVEGDFVGEKMEVSQVLEAPWGVWKQIYDDPEVLTTDTGFGKAYDVNPYESYLANPDHLSYPIEYQDDRVPLKERVLGVIINDRAKVYQFKDFENE